MISGEAKELDCKVKFMFNTLISMDFTLHSSDLINQTNYLTSIKLNEETSAENNIPVGVNSSSTLDLEIISTNHALVPDNENSVYYGYMNNDVILEVTVTIDNEDIMMGYFFVNSWKASSDSSSPNKVTISATNNMSSWANQEVPDVSICSTYTEDRSCRERFIKDYLIALIDDYNSKTPQGSVYDKRIRYRAADINFDTFPTMYLSNLEGSNISDVLNLIAQATLTNIYVDRDGYLRTDYCCDDTVEEATYQLDVLTAANLGNKDQVPYNGIKVNYVKGNLKDEEQLASVSKFQTGPVPDGYNNMEYLIKNVSLGKSVYKITKISISTPEQFITPTINERDGLDYSKDKINYLYPEAYNQGSYYEVEVKVFGQRLDDTVLTYVIEGDNQLEVNNKLIESDYIQKYAENMMQLISFKNNTIAVSGYFTPKIKLGDIIYINCQNAISVSGYYKVHKLNWEFGAYGKCNLTAVKTFTVDYDLTSVMADLNSKLVKTMLAQFPNSSEYVDLSAPENNYANTSLNNELETLRELQYGG